MPWYWILILISVIVGPFEALYALNRAWKKRQERQRKEEKQTEKSPGRDPS